MRDPDIEGTAALVWQCRQDEVLEPGAHATIACFLICAPFAHPAWAWHMMSVVHLRATPELGEPLRVDFPGATHEVMVLALNPQHDSTLDPDEPATWKYLMPEDVVHQVLLADDDQAVELARVLSLAVAHGELIPDSDWRGRWEAALDLTTEHIRLDGHPGAVE